MRIREASEPEKSTIRIENATVVAHGLHRVIPLPLRYPALVAALSTLSIAAAADFHDHIGMQLWSMRAMTLAHPDAALAAVHDYGITEVETAGTANRTAEQFAASLKAHQLVAVGAHEGWDLPGVIREAKALGVTEVICPMLPQKVLPLDEASARRVAAQFNAWGRALAAEGLRFGSHTHGMEFRPLGNGTADTAFDVLVRETRPEWVNFEMDVFWVRHGGGDPVALLKKYSGRWTALHLKDMRVGAPTGKPDAKSPPGDCVAVGSGAIPWPEVLRAADRAGVQHYYIEDETPDPAANIPVSLAYLRGLKL
jgi:sugar phosphate isomerase/epimerase